MEEDYIEEIRTQRYGVIEEASTKVSKLASSLAWYGVAIIWVLRAEEITECGAKLLLVSLLLCSTSILFSLLQYMMKTMVNQFYS